MKRTNFQTTEEEVKNVVEDGNENETLCVCEALCLIDEDKGNLMNNAILYENVITYTKKFKTSNSFIKQYKTVNITKNKIMSIYKIIKEFANKLVELKDIGITEQNEGILVNYMCMFGILAIQIKNFIKKEGINWDHWVEHNLKGLSTKEIEDYISIVSYCKDYDEYTWLGIERLAGLAKAVKEAKCDNERYSISYFLEGHCIYTYTYPSLFHEWTVEECKEIVDETLNTHHIYNKCVWLTQNMLEKICDMHLPTEPGLARRLAIIKLCGGSVSKYVDILHSIDIPYEISKKLREKGINIDLNFLENLKIIKSTGGDPIPYLNYLCN